MELCGQNRPWLAIFNFTGLLYALLFQKTGTKGPAVYENTIKKMQGIDYKSKMGAEHAGEAMTYNGVGHILDNHLSIIT